MSAVFSWPDVTGIVSSRLQSAFGWDSERATQVAEIISESLRREYGGKKHYIPRKNTEIRARIKKEFTGRNVAELSRVYGLSCRTIMRYAKK